MAKADELKARMGLTGPPLGRLHNAPTVVPDHEMVRRIGQGSYGEVWLAHNAVGTWRAIKVVHRARFEDARPYDREFAGIQKYEPISRTNEGLVDVLQIGRNDAEGYFYYVMELADDASEENEKESQWISGKEPSPQGPSLTHSITPEAYVPKTLAREIKSRGRLPVEECITLGMTLNLALGHLHRQDLIHRDVKPSNIIFVNGVPKLADIGLVTDLADAQSFVGTEGFIPPEGPNSPQADLYALGKVLYEAAMGKDRQEFPEPYTNLGADADSKQLMELNEVLLKACADKPKQRYQTAEEMNADLALLHSGKSVQQKHALERRLKATKRLAATVIAVMLLAVVPYYFALKESRRARIAEADAMEKLRDSYLAQAQAGRFSHRIGRRFESLEMLGRAAKIRPALDLRNEAVACMALPDMHLVKEWQLPLGATVAFDQQFQLYALGDTNGEITIRRMLDHKQLFSLLAFKKSPVTSLNFSPDGRLLAANYPGSDNHYTVWNIREQKPLLDWTNFVHLASDFSCDSRYLAVSQAHGPLLVQDLTKSERIVPDADLTRAYCLAFHPNRAMLAISFATTLLKVLDVASGKTQAEWNFPESVDRICWHPNGKWLAAEANRNSRIYLWDVASYTNVTMFVGTQEGMTKISFTRDGSWLASASWDGTFRLWDTFSGQPIVDRRNLGEAFFKSDDDQTWAQIDKKAGHIGIWEVSKDRELRHIRKVAVPGMPALRSAFHPNGQLFAECSPDGTRIWSCPSGEEMLFLPIGFTDAVAFHPEGKSLLTCTHAGLQNWPLNFSADGSIVQIGEPRALSQPGEVLDVSICSKGRLAYVQYDAVHICGTDGSEDKKLNTSTNSIVKRAVLSPDGRLVVTWGEPPRNFEVRDVESRRMVKRFDAVHSTCACFSRDGSSLAIADWEDFQLVRVSDWQPLLSHRKKSGHPVRDMAFSSDSRILAVALETVVQLLDARSGRELVTLEAPNPGAVSQLEFSARDRDLAVTSNNRGTQLWCLPRIRKELANIGLDWELPPSTLSADTNGPLTVAIHNQRDGAAELADVRSRISPRDPSTASNMLDLSEFYNAVFTDSWLPMTFQNNNLSSLPTGVQIFEGTPFDVRGIIQLASTSTDLKPGYPREVLHMPVGRRCQALTFLHSTAWASPAGTQIGDYVVQYTGGAKLNIPIVCGENMADWWFGLQQPPPFGPIALGWKGSNPDSLRAGAGIALYKLRWTNPLPGLEITSINFRSAMTVSAPFLIAITTE